MNSDRLAKHWKIVEVQLNQAAEFLTEPCRFSVKKMELEDYSGFVDSNEFELAMEELAGVAQAHGCKSGFWRRLKKVAVQMDLPEKAAEYERLFHEALDRNV